MPFKLMKKNLRALGFRMSTDYEINEEKNKLKEQVI